MLVRTLAFCPGTAHTRALKLADGPFNLPLAEKNGELKATLAMVTYRD